MNQQRAYDLVRQGIVVSSASQTWMAHSYKWGRREVAASNLDPASQPASLAPGSAKNNPETPH